ncbi:MAG: thioredoxin family protein [Ignavibacteriales bacterium]|nr:MAG: thioredoxin family protein [Ignavibacteriales bacterium]
MKNLFALSFLVLLIFTGCGKESSGDNLEWETNLESAIKKAKAENKSILVNFTGSDWCVWCQRLSNEVFSQSEFEEYANEKLVLVKLDFPRDIKQTQETKLYNNQLLQRYGVQGFPTIILLNSSGVMIAQTGYQPGGAANYVMHLKSYL